MQAIFANYLQINNKIKKLQGMYAFLLFFIFFHFKLFYILINEMLLKI
jgi:hypothetical protein